MNSKKTIDVAAAGHICLDIIPEFADIKAGKIDDILTPGGLVNVGESTISTGGPVSNTGIALAKLGLKVALIGKVGDDLFGKATTDLLQKYVKPHGMTIARGENSSYTIVIAIPGIDRIFLHNPGTNDTFGYSDIDFDVVKNAKLFHLGYPPLMKNLYINEGAQLIKIFSGVQSMGVTTSLDMALPDPDSESGKANWDSILKKLLPYVDIFTPSIEEVMFMIDRKRLLSLKQQAKGEDIVNFFKPDDLTNISDTLLSYGAKIVALKCGHRGFYLRTTSIEKLYPYLFPPPIPFPINPPLSPFTKGGREIGAGRIKEREKGNSYNIKLDKTVYAKPANSHGNRNGHSYWSNREMWAPSYYVERIASATGSGDSAAAGFLTGYLKEESPEVCMRCANAAGAQNLSALDALSGIKTWDEVTEMASSSDANLGKLEIHRPGWEYDKTERLWRGPGDKKQ